MSRVSMSRVSVSRISEVVCFLESTIYKGIAVFPHYNKTHP